MKKEQTKETKLSFLEQFGYFSGDFGGSLIDAEEANNTIELEVQNA